MPCERTRAPERLCVNSTVCRYRPLKPSCGDVQQDLLNKLQRHDFALNDTDNNGCRWVVCAACNQPHSQPAALQRGAGCTYYVLHAAI